MDDLKALEIRLNARMDTQFDLLNQAITLVRDDAARRLAEQEEQIMGALRSALAAQRRIIEESFGQVQEAVGGLRDDLKSNNSELLGHLRRQGLEIEGLKARLDAVERRLAG